MKDTFELKLDLAELSQREEMVFGKLYSFFYLIRMIEILVHLILDKIFNVKLNFYILIRWANNRTSPHLSIVTK